MNPTGGHGEDGGFSGDAFGSADDITWEPQPVCWPRLDPDTALNAWHGLDAWIRWCIRRYGLDHRTIPPCWYQHDALVEELSALRTGWQSAYSPTAPGNAPLEWQALFSISRQRLQEWVARSGCRSDEHRNQQQVTWVEEPDANFLSHVSRDIELRATRTGAEPD